MRKYSFIMIVLFALLFHSCSGFNNINGAKSRLLSYAVMVINTPAAPRAPTNLQVITESSSQLNLSWHDNSNNETEFMVERSSDNVNFSTIAVLSSNTAVYNDAGLPSDTLYYYRVRASNSIGDSEFSNVISGTTFAVSTATQIIADHTIVARYDDIPAYWIGEVKKMMVAFPGESHSYAYRRGLELLEEQNAYYACNVSTGEAPTDAYLRVNESSCGESTWYTWYAYDDHNGGDAGIMKAIIDDYYNDGHPMSVLGFGWCWDTTWMNGVTENKDPVYGCGWAGSSVGGPDGNVAWGLDAGDYVITGNRVSLETYLGATEDYRLYCITQGYPTRVVFTTSPADGAIGELGYQRHLKHERIREFVLAHAERVLFDYCDILCYDDDGSIRTTTWNSHEYPIITLTNAGDQSVGHIGEAGAIRLAKAQWWLLARVAGWDGVSP